MNDARDPSPFLGTDDPVLRPGHTGEAFFRGHLSRDECALELAGHDLAPTGDPLHTWGRRGFWTDDDGDCRTGGLHVRASYAGTRGAFRVTLIDVEYQRFQDDLSAKETP